jgi:glucose/arabinose dehydrogenase
MSLKFVIIAAACAAIAGCLGSSAARTVQSPAAPPAAAGVPVSGPPPDATGWRQTTLVSGMTNPWGMAWLPGGGILITERPGRLTLARDGTKRNVPMPGAPAIAAIGQGGLMDVALHPDFANNRLVYLTLAIGSPRENRTALMRGTFDGRALTGARIIYQNPVPKQGGQHFGSRLLWLPDGTLLMSIGDGGNPPASTPLGLARAQVQRLGTAFGKVLRLDENGRPAPGNPFAGREGALPEVWSYGLRNVQGLARDPASGRIWATDHGARGGDELNLLEAGRNYGWPLATHSLEYSGQEITPHRSRPGMVDPLVVWTPSPAPSGLAFYTGDRFPAWRGDLFSGGLAGQDVRRIDLDAHGKVLGQERLRIGARVRDVRQGPDGYLYLLTDQADGRLIRIEPD